MIINRCVINILGDLKDYCLFESFSARCRDNEVIMVQHASYGRMKTGRCISGEGIHSTPGLINSPLNLPEKDERINISSPYMMFFEAEYFCNKCVVLTINCKIIIDDREEQSRTFRSRIISLPQKANV